MNHAIDLILFVILSLAAIVMEVIGAIDGVLAHLMTRAGVPHNAQIILLVVAAIWLVVMALRLLGGIFSALLIVLLLLLILHQAYPGFAVGPAHAPAAAVGTSI